MDWILRRLRDPAFYRGLALVAAAFGVAVKPEDVATISALGMAASGAIGMLVTHPTVKAIEEGKDPIK